MKKHLTILFLLFVSIGFAQERRLALVVGNSEYVGKGSYLKNPVNDANDVSAKLKALGFEVTSIPNASYLEMEDAIEALGAKAKDYDVALFYYSGHGLQTNGENYLVPVDAILTTAASIRARCTSVNYLLDLLDESGCPLKIVCLDACRNNPFERNKGFSKGLSGIDASEGSLISFATARGKTADDGNGHNSPYTTAFLNALDQPNLKILDFFNAIATQVKSLTQNTQMPWANFSSLNGDFCFNKKATPAPVVAQATTPPQPTLQKSSTTQPQPQTVSAPVVTPTQSSPEPPTDTKSESLTITANGVSFVMKRMAGGTFSMGGNNIGAYDNEKLVHSVTVSTFYMGETEVTQALWKAVMGDNPSHWQGDNLPVETVSWNDCQKFICKLNQLTGRNFRLPTEAEWEYAARGGNKSNGYTFSGSNDIGSVAWYTANWYTDNSGRETHEVKGKLPNELGLYDMSGNVWEWCQDRYDNYSSSSQTNPKGASSGSSRVVRGGCRINDARGCRVSNRGNFGPRRKDEHLGLRLALSE